MKLEMVMVDLELSRPQRRVLAASLGLAGALAAGAALADVPDTFVAGQTLKAADLNLNFNEIEIRLATTESGLAAVEDTLAPSSSVAMGNPGTFNVTSQVFTKVAYSIVLYDELDEFDELLSRFTATKTGDYLICASQRAAPSVPFELDVASCP